MRAALLCAALAGCAVAPGDHLLTVLPDVLSARLGGRPGRFTPDGWLTTTEGYALRLDRLQLETAGLTLAGGGRPLLTLAAAAPVPVATRTPATPLGGVALGPCTPGCGLEAGPLDAAHLPLVRLRLDGQVRDLTGRRLAAPTAVAVDLPLDDEDVVLTRPLGLRLDRQAPERLVVRAVVEVAPALADGVDWAALPRQGGALCLSADLPCEGAAAAHRLRQGLGQAALAVDLTAPEE